MIKALLMHHCKACGSSVCNPKEMRVLHKSTSTSVSQTLIDYSKTLDETDLVKFNDEYLAIYARNAL